MAISDTFGEGRTWTAATGWKLSTVSALAIGAATVTMGFWHGSLIPGGVVLGIFEMATMVTGGFALGQIVSGGRRGRAVAGVVEAAREEARNDEYAQLLRLIMDSQAKSILVVDSRGILRFANAGALITSGLSAERVMDRHVRTLLGTAEAARLTERCREALSADGPVVAIDRYESDAVAGDPVPVSQTQYIPLPVGPFGADTVLIMRDDITSTTYERERRARTLNRLVETLVTVVDQRDPHAAKHSVRVAHLSANLARRMGLEKELVETVDIAGLLMNLGKVLVPTSVLTKPGEFDSAERQLMSRSLRSATDLLNDVEFDGPVMETLHYIHPDEIEDTENAPEFSEDVPLTARIVAVANAFVALVSPRAHRPQASIEVAMSTLRAGAGITYDQLVIDALGDYLASGGSSEWETPRVN